MGTDGDDVICGGGGDDRIQGLGGADLIRGGGGNDVIDGGDGADALKGEDGDDSVSGGPGDDAIDGDGGQRVDPNAPPGRDVIACGEGHDLYVSDAGDSVGQDCEEPLVYSRPAGTIQERFSSGGPAPPPAPVGAPARAGSFVASIRRLVAARRGDPVKVVERDLLVEDGKLAVVIECLPGSLDRGGRLVLTATGGRREVELAAGDFQCDRPGRISVEIEASEELIRLLEDGDEVRAVLAIRFRGRTIRIPVTIRAAEPGAG